MKKFHYTVEWILCAFIFVLILTGAAGARPQGDFIWQHDVVASEGSVGRFASLALSSAGTPCISYFDGNGDGDLKYTCRVGGTWQTETVDSDHVGWSTSLAMDAADHPHISYYRYSGSIKYAYYDGAAWHTETVEGYGAQFGEYNALALDADGRPHIAYTAGGVNWQMLKYARYDGSIWHKETVDGMGSANVGSYVSLALDADGHPHLSYQDDTNLDLRYAYHDGSAWHTETVDAEGETGYYTSLAVDSEGHPHIAYMNALNAVRYAYYDGSAWHTEKVDMAWDLPVYPSLALDGDDRPHIAYSWYNCLDNCVNKVKYASYNGADWQIEDAAEDVNTMFTYLSLALDSSDQPHIAYCEDVNDDLRYARGISPALLTNQIYLPMVLKP